MNGQERAKTRPDGNDPKESFGAPHSSLPSCSCFSDSRLLLLLLFPILFRLSPRALPAIPRRGTLCLSFLFLTWDNRERVEATDTEQDKAKTSSDGNDFDIFFRHRRLFLTRLLSLLYYCHDSLPFSHLNLSDLFLRISRLYRLLLRR